MKCSCIETYKFVIITNKDKILLIDDSEWVGDKSEYEVAITFPDNLITYKACCVIPERVLEITMKDIFPENSFEYFPDGIYSLKVESCGVTHTDYFLMTSELDCKLANLAINPPYCEDYKEAKVFRDAAHANVKCETCNVKKVTEFYEAAYKLVENEKCKC